MDISLKPLETGMLLQERTSKIFVRGYSLSSPVALTLKISWFVTNHSLLWCQNWLKQQTAVCFLSSKLGFHIAILNPSLKSRVPPHGNDYPCGSHCSCEFRGIFRGNRVSTPLFFLPLLCLSLLCLTFSFYHWRAFWTFEKGNWRFLGSNDIVML